MIAVIKIAMVIIMSALVLGIGSLKTTGSDIKPKAGLCQEATDKMCE